jgi:serine/threonine-protein kinase
MPRPVRRKTRRILFSHEGTDYEHVQLVTEGPHGERVLLARRHPPEGPPELVVVKALSCRHPREALRRWRHEVWLASHLAHPGIARVLGHHPRASTAYTVSEFIEGRSLEKALAYAALRGQPLSEPLGLHVCAEVAGPSTMPIPAWTHAASPWASSTATCVPPTSASAVGAR